ncbi:hypothetical protein BDV93DRAFT_267532 [Ceratobasidium sp. AG-I]|nr:hypothetical protein BDV93DRAFT_267532 [Ceratobasidium sp. AG-I]
MANLDPLALQCFLILSRLICSLATCGTLWILWVFEPRLLIWGMPIFILVTTNDILMLTLDLQRTNSYVGSTLFQGMVSLMSITSFIIYFKRSNSYSVLAYMGSGEEAIYLACAIPAIVPALISFFLLICNVQTLLSTQLPVPIWSAWSTNSKDITLGFNPASSPPRLTWRGDSRTVPLPNRRRLFWLGMVVIGRKVWGVVTNLFLRRVSPSETTIYAFIRNTFAVISMAFIMWRAGVAISKAQNAFEMRRVSEICNQPQPDISSIQILFVCFPTSHSVYSFFPDIIASPQAIPKAYPDCLNNAPDFTINELVRRGL